jgi:hypothetical protein
MSNYKLYWGEIQLPLALHRKDMAATWPALSPSDPERVPSRLQYTSDHIGHLQ